MVKLLVFTNIFKCKGGNIDHSVNLGEQLNDGTERRSIVTHDSLIKPMIDHVEEPLFVGRIASQSDLLSTTLWRSGLGNIDGCEVSPINYMDSQRSPRAKKWARHHLRFSFVTGAGTQRRTGGAVETRAGMFDENVQRRKDAGWAQVNTLFYDPHYIGFRVKGTNPQTRGECNTTPCPPPHKECKFRASIIGKE
jgi:hypothetical protein